ncbi:hypothetical protein J3E69DRAFT_335612 [Trichoderma sp. SZMC 28015]
MGLAAYPHPFRFCSEAGKTDFLYAGIGVDSEGLDEDRMLKLIEQVKSKVPGIETTKRVTLWPWMMPGSKIPIQPSA